MWYSCDADMLEWSDATAAATANSVEVPFFLPAGLAYDRFGMRKVAIVTSAATAGLWLCALPPVPPIHPPNNQPYARPSATHKRTHAC